MNISNNLLEMLTQQTKKKETAFWNLSNKPDFQERGPLILTILQSVVK